MHVNVQHICGGRSQLRSVYDMKSYQADTDMGVDHNPDLYVT